MVASATRRGTWRPAHSQARLKEHLRSYAVSRRRGATDGPRATHPSRGRCRPTNSHVCVPMPNFFPAISCRAIDAAFSLARDNIFTDYSLKSKYFLTNQLVWVRWGALRAGAPCRCTRERTLGCSCASHRVTRLKRAASHLKNVMNLIGQLVGATGFEPATPSPPDWCATRLRYAPMGPLCPDGLVRSTANLTRHSPKTSPMRRRLQGMM